MANVYTFKVKAVDLEDILWREIEISDVSSVAKLGYTVLAAFGASGSHLFNIKYDGKRYEFLFEEDFFDELLGSAINPAAVKLKSLGLEPGNMLTMEYDYGASWEFSIEMVSIVPMKNGAGSHYPYVTDGAGKGMIGDNGPGFLQEVIESTKDQGPLVMNPYTGEEFEYDYKDFNLRITNSQLKIDIEFLRKGYEQED